MSTVVSVENLCKSYRLGQIGTGTFTNDLKVWWAKTRGRPNPFLRIGEQDHGNRDGEEIWALRDVSFTIQQGEVLGIIGKNGAGKSTLLKILSRVTAPTSGRIKVKGRIASLLEVGTGFHPELTGRENIFLNGAILGMGRKEIKQKFDEIVDFAEVEKFIDTPVKRYSSGMYVRLAFSVAAHLESEILVVDEVLAVGDAEFQKKCLGKMGDVAKVGRTVLFVSHNMGIITKLVNNCVLIDKGKISQFGNAKDVIENYTYKNISKMGERQFPDLSSKEAQIKRIATCNINGEVTGILDPVNPFLIELDFVVRNKCKFFISFMIEHNSVYVFNSGTYLDETIPRNWAEGNYRVQMVFPGNILNSGNYEAWSSLSQIDGLRLDTIGQDPLSFSISALSEVGRRGPRSQTLRGVLSILPEYRFVDKLSEDLNGQTL